MTVLLYPTVGQLKKIAIEPNIPVLPDPGEELFSSLLEEEERTPPDVFSDLSTVLLSIDLGEGWEGGGEGEGEGEERGGGRQRREQRKDRYRDEGRKS